MSQQGEIASQKRKIGDYELIDSANKMLDDTEISTQLNNIFGQKALEKLYVGCTEPTKQAREKFLDSLESLRTSPSNQENKSFDTTITLEQLLGKAGVEQYKQAIKEERNSKSFRAAILYKATQERPGPPWQQRMMLWIGGPSGCGKSFSANSLLNRIAKDMPVDDNKAKDSKNYLVAVDGGIERDLSQMRKMVLQLALSQGYKGIQDLHKNTEFKLKGHLKKTALERNDISLIIPDTFVSGFVNKLKNILDFSQQKGTKAIFARIKGPAKKGEQFQQTVKALGDKRAWAKEFNSEIEINHSKLGCESKEYNPKYFDLGKNFSHAAQKVFEFLQPQGAAYVIENDLLVKEGQMITARAYAQYEQSCEEQPNLTLKDWIDNNKALVKSSSTSIIKPSTQQKTLTVTQIIEEIHHTCPEITEAGLSEIKSVLNQKTMNSNISKDNSQHSPAQATSSTQQGLLFNQTRPNTPSASVGAAPKAQVPKEQPIAQPRGLLFNQKKTQNTLSASVEGAPTQQPIAQVSGGLLKNIKGYVESDEGKERHLTISRETEQTLTVTAQDGDKSVNTFVAQDSADSLSFSIAENLSGDELEKAIEQTCNIAVMSSVPHAEFDLSHTPAAQKDQVKAALTKAIADAKNNNHFSDDNAPQVVDRPQPTPIL
jgi:hypothetical protein